MAVVAIVFAFTIPFVIKALTRKWAYTLGGLLVIVSGLAMLAESQPGQLLAMLTRTLGAATLNVTLNLYIMDNIRKQDLVRSEPLRYGISTVAWTMAPLGGVWLFENWGVWAVSAFVTVSSLAMLAAFWFLRLSEGGPIRQAKQQPANPAIHIRRFVAQPRLVLAWLIAFGRSAFWSTFFVYVPILLTDGGYGAMAAGYAIAAGNLMLFNNLFVADLAQKITVRRVLTASYLVSALLVLIAGATTPHSAAGAAILLVVASFFVSVMDGLGPIPFLRAVRPHEKGADDDRLSYLPRYVGTDSPGGVFGDFPVFQHRRSAGRPVGGNAGNHLAVLAVSASPALKANRTDRSQVAAIATAIAVSQLAAKRGVKHSPACLDLEPE